jgi:hypothetical protein
MKKKNGRRSLSRGFPLHDSVRWRIRIRAARSFNPDPGPDGASSPDGREGTGGFMDGWMTRLRVHWEPIRNPVFQNTLVGLVLGIVIGFNLKLIYMRIHGPAVIWLSFSVLGLFVGLLSGLERYRWQDGKSETET